MTVSIRRPSNRLGTGVPSRTCVRFAAPAAGAATNRRTSTWSSFATRGPMCCRPPRPRALPGSPPSFAARPPIAERDSRRPGTRGRPCPGAGPAPSPDACRALAGIRGADRTSGTPVARPCQAPARPACRAPAPRAGPPPRPRRPAGSGTRRRGTRWRPSVPVPPVTRMVELIASPFGRIGVIAPV